MNKKKPKKEVKINIPKTKNIKKEFKQSLTIDNQKKKNKISLFENPKRKENKIILLKDELISENTRNKNYMNILDNNNNITLPNKNIYKIKEKEIENTLLRKSQILPKVIKNNCKLNKEIVTEVKRKSISIIPLILPNITPSNRFVHKYQIGNF